MDMNVRLILSCLFYLLSFSTFSQSVDFDKKNFEDKEGLKAAKDALSDGDAFFERGPVFYKDAIPFYLKAQQFNSKNAELNFKLGKCYLKSPFKQKALPYLQKALELSPTVNPEIDYLLGMAYHLATEWEKAITYYTNHKNRVMQTSDLDAIAEIQNRISQCIKGRELVKTPVRVFIDNLGPNINTQYNEYGGVISADESVLLFTARRPNSTGGGIDPNLNEHFEDMYIAYKQADGQWTTGINLPKTVNSEDHDAVSAIAADGQRFIIYLGNVNAGDLFESVLTGSEWSKPEPLGKNINTKYHEPSACYSPDGNILYFVSDVPGGEGKHDIYYSRKDPKGKWGPPVNIGKTINTRFNEESVFMHPDGKTLFFSSQGHESIGGFDIFKTVYDAATNTWSVPKNIGYPINTTDDDVFFVLSASGRHGYYMSAENTGGYGGRDLYMITFLGPEKPMVQNHEDNLIASHTEPIREIVTAPAVELTEAKLTLLKGIIFDQFTGKPLEAIIEIADNRAGEIIATFQSNSSTGNYLVTLPAGKNYGITVKKEDYLFHSENFDIPDTAAFRQVKKDIGLNQIEVGKKIVLNNIFYDFDKATLRPESKSELERLIALLNEYPTMKIELGAHTDSRGTNEYNRVLSANRAKSVVDYLIQGGIAPGKLVSKGYGEEQPIATNDTDEGRQLNRRTEFKILNL
jgi:outer membrane protein OmpA-like peptidoglycan-associated protein